MSNVVPPNPKIIDWWWEDNDFLFETEDGKIIRCINAYITDVKFGDLEYTEETTFIMPDWKKYSA